MSGADFITVPPSSAGFSGATAGWAFGAPAGQWLRGIPDLGVHGAMAGMSAPTNVADCHNLFRMSPPTLLEAYEIYSLSIGWTIVLHATAPLAANPNVTAELALLVNDRVRYTAVSELTPSSVITGTPVYLASGAWNADLVNPLAVGARERLSLRVGVRSDEATDSNTWGFVGVQATPANPPLAVASESTISYRVIDLPGSRRL